MDPRNPKKLKKGLGSTLFGHHYTHAFFTISASEPHHLRKVSQEFVFPSQSHENDGDWIQFASSLEWVHGDQDNDDQSIIITYGVNDCEGFFTKVDWKTGESTLKVLQNPSGKLQVTHLMRGASETWTKPKVAPKKP